MAFTVYQPAFNNPLKNISAADMLNHQKILAGTDPELLSSTGKGVFFLDTLILESGQTVTITDGDDNSIGSGITGFQLNNNHIRLDGGIKITGTVIMAKGYLIENVLN